jgi:hypothetical protein
MASQFPAALDQLASDKGNATVSADDHPTHHNKLADAVNAVQAALGVNLQNVLKPLVEYTTDPPSPILGSQWLYRVELAPPGALQAMAGGFPITKPGATSRFYLSAQTTEGVKRVEMI